MTNQTTGHPLRTKIGLSAAMTTPFIASGEIDWGRYAAHARNLLTRGMQAVTAFGTTGEGISIPVAMRASLYEQMAARGVQPGQLVECVYGLSVSDAAAQAGRAIEAGCAAVLLTPPFYFKDPSEEGVHAWFSRTLEAIGPSARDIILYNIPQLTGVTVGLDSLARLRRTFGAVIGGVKDSGGNWTYTEKLARANADIAVLVGNEGHLAAAVRLGASGAISGLANFAPELVGRLVSGVDDPRIEGLLRAVLARPVVPAIKAYMGATLDPAWREVLPPLQALAPADTAKLVAEIDTAVAGVAA
ncbi:dihydrodipicolinate synthase family protein [Devosia sp. CN2-171]|uniref:dihydrodipicolinate synthase family protein n=1 Tax=Devosia sp. CN2-171 TaxID=3400909 RepID=UPI003BF7A5B2